MCRSSPGRSKRASPTFTPSAMCATGHTESRRLRGGRRARRRRVDRASAERGRAACGFDGRGACYIEFGAGRIGRVDVDFFSDPEANGHVTSRQSRCEPIRSISGRAAVPAGSAVEVVARAVRAIFRPLSHGAYPGGAASPADLKRSVVRGRPHSGSSALWLARRSELFPEIAL